MIKHSLKILGPIAILSACQTNPSENLSQINPTETNSDSIANIEELNLSSNSIFQTILPELEAKTKLIPSLPTYIPEYKSDPPLHAILTDVDQSKYKIVLGYTPDCTGQNACRFGNIEATTANSESSLQGEQTVTLDNDTKAYFTDAVCNAYCTDSTLTWKQDSVVHSIGIKAGKIETLVKIANSM